MVISLFKISSYSTKKKRLEKIKYKKIIFISFNKIRIFMYFESRENEADQICQEILLMKKC